MLPPKVHISAWSMSQDVLGYQHDGSGTLAKLQHTEEMGHVWSSSDHLGRALEGDCGTAASSSSSWSLLAMR